MKKLALFACAGLLLASCSKYGDVKQFVTDFAATVTTGDKAAIQKMYPDAALADSLAIDFQKDSLQVEENGDTFVVHLNANSSMSIVKDEEGELKIADSHGLFAYAADRMVFGLKTGWITPDMNDGEIARQFSDTTFVKYLATKTVEEIKSQFRVKGISYNYSSGQMVYDKYYGGMAPAVLVNANVINQSEYEISGSDYQVYVGYSRFNQTFPGKDMKPGETQTFTLKASPQEAMGTASVRFMLSDEELLAKYFTPKGGEYEEYQHSPMYKK